jgi:hypothetical protein
VDLKGLTKSDEKLSDGKITAGLQGVQIFGHGKCADLHNMTKQPPFTLVPHVLFYTIAQCTMMIFNALRRELATSPHFSLNGSAF